jgi:hypothetical protein
MIRKRIGKRERQEGMNRKNKNEKKTERKGRKRELD